MDRCIDATQKKIRIDTAATLTNERAKRERVEQFVKWTTGTDSEGYSMYQFSDDDDLTELVVMALKLGYKVFVRECGVIVGVGGLYRPIGSYDPQKSVDVRCLKGFGTSVPQVLDGTYPLDNVGCAVRD